MKSGLAMNSAGFVASTLIPCFTEACIPIVPLALWIIARSTIEMNGLTIMLATAAAATSLRSRAASTPRAPTLAKRLGLALPPLLRLVVAKKPRAAAEVAAEVAAAATAAVAAVVPGRSNRGAWGRPSLLCRKRDAGAFLETIVRRCECQFEGKNIDENTQFRYNTLL